MDKATSSQVASSAIPRAGRVADHELAGCELAGHELARLQAASSQGASSPDRELA
ncbi:UNVERIFIED_CONTAM: hypothetical protein Slati_1694400 [Sesamum latifolium]|uniref:Uncharacterized protein n=1 Tax=Sesamum latifolium TaxID=2727402 RepID=A0AAW2X017_9LAMI